MKSPKAGIAELVKYMRGCDSTITSQAMAQELSNAISSTRPEVVPPKSKPSDILGMSVSSGMDSWAVKGHITTEWVDELIKQPPTIKHLGRPKVKDD